MISRGRPSLDIDSNPVFLRILTLIANGVNTPVELCGRLGLKPTTLVKYLNILRRNGFLRYGEKSGKNQPYIINWSRVAESFIDAVLGGRLWHVALKEVELIPIRGRLVEEVFSRLEKAEEVADLKVKELASKPEVLDIVRSGLEELGRNPDIVKKFNIGLRDFFKSFKDMLLKIRGIYELNIEDEELRRIFSDTSFHLSHPGDFDWFKTMEKRGKILKRRA